MAISKRKTMATAVVGVTAAALLVGGTFAWVSISQQTLSESAGIVNVGGRLHDDFNGTNKDVYVENFTNAATGGQPIYARIRLDEYMEVGGEAGNLTDPDRNAKPIADTMDETDVDSWITHIPGAENDPSKCTTGCNSTSDCLLHTHWEWEMGGSTHYMPTFNKDKDSLDADINGTYNGTDDNDKIYYDDYVVYTTEESGLVIDVVKDGEVALTDAEGKVGTVTAYAAYDNDPDTAINTVEGDHYITKQESHTAKQTATAEVITMAQWLSDAYNKAPGNYWVYDDDGWAYWANPIMPGEATGLLLSSIDMISNPGEKCYYAINVVAQFATVDDWKHFIDKNDNPDIEEGSNAETLLLTVSQSVPTVEVIGENYVEVDKAYTFTATASRGATSTAAQGDFEWSVVDENGDPVDASIATVTEDESGNGQLTVNADKAPDGATLIVLARSTDETHLGATGVKAVAVKNSDALIPDIEITLDDSTITNISAIPLTANVMHNLAAYDDAPVVWSITDESGNTVSDSVAYVEDDTLHIAQTEGTVTLNLTATCTILEETNSETVTVTFNASEFCDTCGTKYTDNGFCTANCTSGQYEPAVLSADGTEYEISNGGQLFWLAQQVNAGNTSYNATLVEDISLEGGNWTPIGNSDSNAYSGTFDGGGNSITDLSIDATEGDQGLFGFLGSATVQNFSVSGEMSISDLPVDDRGFGTIASVTGKSTISGIHSDLDIKVESSTGKVAYIGGILGYVWEGGGPVTVENCSYTGSISGVTENKYDCIGGIVAYVYRGHTATINNCLFAGEINVGTTTFMGGMLGYYNGSNMTIQNCLSCGILSTEGTDSKVVGAIAGILRNSSDCAISNNYYCLASGSNDGLDAFGCDDQATDREDSDEAAVSANVTELTDSTVCKKLNGSSTNGVWIQGVDYPTPNTLS